jgi:hypothetical protein
VGGNGGDPWGSYSGYEMGPHLNILSPYSSSPYPANNSSPVYSNVYSNMVPQHEGFGPIYPGRGELVEEEPSLSRDYSDLAGKGLMEYVPDLQHEDHLDKGSPSFCYVNPPPPVKEEIPDDQHRDYAQLPSINFSN